MNGVLKKFGYNPIATKMGFNNSMFIKDLKYLQRKVIRHLIDENDTARILAKSILDLQDSIFYGISDDSILSYQVSRLIDLEKQQLRTSDESEFNIFNSYEDVINALSEGEAVIDIISYVGFPNMETDKEERLKLGALIAKPWLEAPLFVELCDDDSLRNLAIRTIMDGAMGYNNLYADSTKFILYNLLFKNIEPLVADSKVLFISPKLLTNHINWGWIKCPDGQYLNDKYSVRIVASPSELIDKVDKISINDVTVFGGPDFSQNDNRKKSTIRDIILSSKGVNIDYLPGSLDELKEIQSLFSKTDIPIRSYSGDYANEKNFRELSGVSPSIVHVATHAYYLVGFANIMTNYLSSYITRFGNDASMIYSGLLLSCAKNSIENGTTNIGADDGILTSEEISYMDFSNTQLVVLSACNSGEGVSVEGYGGLPKAFRLAGAKCVLMSLWDISDELTSQFMKSFYTHLIQTKAPYLALKNAQYEMMSCYKDPYYWASFVLLE